MAINGASILGRISWGLGLTVLVYLAFLMREIVAASGSNRAVGLGARFVILYSPWFWTTTALAPAVTFLWKSR